MLSSTHFLLKFAVFSLTIFTPLLCSGALWVGVATKDITPPIGTPSAGYEKRAGFSMEGINDPLLAIAMVIDTGEKKLAFCSVDHLGMPYNLVKQCLALVAERAPELANCRVYIGSSHTHSGGGAYLDIPIIGEMLAGKFDPAIARLYVEGIASAIVEAAQKMQPAKIGIGYGEAKTLSQYRSVWPADFILSDKITVLKVTREDDTPLAALFNFALNPTVLGSENRLFSADFVGFTRKSLASRFGDEFVSLYFNGAQAEVVPSSAIQYESDHQDIDQFMVEVALPALKKSEINEEQIDTFLAKHIHGIYEHAITHQSIKTEFARCKRIGGLLAESVTEIWNATTTQDSLVVDVEKKEYFFIPKRTPFGFLVPIERYDSELNLIVLNHQHLFVTIPGELSCLYDSYLKEQGKNYGFEHVSVLGLTNDAHGYILQPPAFTYKTKESALSFGGQKYGEHLMEQILDSMQNLAPVHTLPYPREQ